MPKQTKKQSITMGTTFDLAAVRVLSDKASKKDLQQLIKLAENEVEEWEKFIKICKEKLIKLEYGDKISGI